MNDEDNFDDSEFKQYGNDLDLPSEGEKESEEEND